MRASIRWSVAVAIIVLMTSGSPSLGAREGLTAAGRGSGSSAPEPPVVRLSLTPAPEPGPALRYSFLPGRTEQKPGNAALVYDTALLAMAEKRHSEALETVKSWLKRPIEDLPAPELREAMSVLRTPLRYAGLAARRRECEWELPYESEGPALILPRLNRVRNLARALALQARLEIAAGRYQEATQTLKTGFAMGRHVGRAPLLINGLVGVAITDLMLERVEELIGAEGAPNCYWALAALPEPLVDLRPAIEQELHGVYEFFPRLGRARRGDLDPGEWRAALRDLERAWRWAGIRSDDHWVGDLTGVGLWIVLYPKARKYLAHHGYTSRQVEEMPVPRALVTYVLDSYQRLVDQQLKWMHVPYRQGMGGREKAQRAIARAARQWEGAPFVRLMPAVGGVLFRTVRLQRRVNALRCVEAIRIYAADHDGGFPAKLSDIQKVPIPSDPVTGKPFKYEVSKGIAVLSAEAPPGRGPQHALRFELTFRR